MQCAAFTTGLHLQGIGSVSVSQCSVPIPHNECTALKQVFPAALQFAACHVLSPCWFVCTKTH